MGLKGTIPPHIGNLSSLSLLSIKNNSFYGSLPNELAHLRSLKTVDFGLNFFTGEIPPWFWSLPELENLVLNDNNFLGAVPSSLSNITSLKKIGLSYNQLSGSISSNFFNASSLRIIDLSFNRLSGRLSIDMVLPDLQELYLSGNQLYGQIPSSLFNYRQLKVLSLSSNNFRGAIPTELGNLTMLNKLCLSHNNLEGTIPWEIGYLTNVKNLSISYNHLTGCIPSSVGNCTLLEEINFSGNKLTGELPPEIGNLSNLEALRVNNNILRGIIPSTVFNISALQVVLLYENSLSGTLPSSIGFFLPNLVELHLQGNELQGIIPSSISNASKLTLLDLTDNFFTGSIPNSIGNLRNLQKLELAQNNLTSESSTVESNFISSLTQNSHLRRIVLSGNPLGSILPMSIGNLSAFLEYFLVSDCKLKGFIPAELGNLSSLIALELGKNELTGIIPNTIGKLQKLQGLHLQSNRLQGTILYDLCQLSSLVELFLGGNELSGSIPECLGNLTAVRNISLGFNRLTSMIPSSLWSLKDILAIDMSSNSLQGSLPLEIGNLRVVTEIDLSKNQLSGYIPSGIGNLQSLVYLSLAENKLQGSIPESFNGSISLEFLDLSVNNISGVIPVSLVELFYLQYFNVSSNELQGEIPSGGPFANFSAQSYMMNKALCGAARLQVPPCKTGTSKGTWRTLFLLLKILLPSIAFYYMLLLIHVLVKQYFQKRMIAVLPTKRRTILYLEIALATDGFSESNLLGTGGFGSVYKGTMKEEKNVAIKVFNMHTERALRSFEDESKLLSIIHHPNIVKLINSCRDDDFKALVLEYMPNGTLDKWLYTHNYFLNLLQRLDVMIEVASAMLYLHARHVVHCDLKPSNILLDEDMVAHVSDFSIAKILDEQKAVKQTSTMSTVGYMAPEYGSSGIISEKTDVYSFGILLMETFTRKKPTDEMFDGEMNLRRWVCESLPRAVDRITDATLLEADQEAIAAKRKCILSIMKVARFCTAELSIERKTMTEVEEELQRIKKNYLRDTEWSDQREIYPSISRQELLLATDGFNESKIVQYGEFGVLYKGQLPHYGVDAAIKVFNRKKRGRESFAVESEVLSFIRHRNVVKILMMCNEVDFKALVLEYIPYGSLEKWLHYIDDNSSRNIFTMLNTMIDVASALCYLHSMRVIHCNLKPSNILLDDDMVAHVSDFSIAKRIGERIAATKTATKATAGYMAPEYESTGTVSEKTDVYSVGILLMETFTRKKPTDEIFNGKMNLRRWVCSSLPHAVESIVDFTSLQSFRRDLAVDRTCILSIMEVACGCTAESSDDRMTMTVVETKLVRIKKEYLSGRR
ncbi:receptor kinase-like protein Xa21 isoform X2 [Durio zibethinus]|nr:receptor kinase-like protein Xa21 isoform X2 [Durio zibethinus]